MDTIYIEKAVEKHPQTKSILQKLPNAERIICDRYQEVFNLKNQNFRLQKQKPALILARKHQGWVLPTPEKYGIGHAQNYYFSHMLNCIYDCRYCFLQGMYRSAHYVIFVNFEDFQKDILKITSQTSAPITFFSGYDGDSLALDQITQFTTAFCPFFEKLKGHVLELRTKSVNIEPLLKLKPSHNVVVAYSLNSEFICQSVEHKTPSLQKRLRALLKLQQAGWLIGLRFDPLIYYSKWQRDYQKLFQTAFQMLDVAKIHSVTLGSFRVPHSIYKNMIKLYPEEKLFVSKIHRQKQGMSYNPDLEQKMHSFCQNQIYQYLPKEKFFSQAL